MAAADPERIDGYVLEGRLGAGGYGIVYAATDTDGKRVALKVLRPELADNPGLKERLAREGAALGRVGGERNVEIYEVVTEGSYTYLAMELVEGETLQERIERDGSLAGPLLWFTAQGLIEALQAIHGAGITHRDLKPSNVMFGPDGVKVLDFGISAIAEETGLTQTGAFLGTAAWIAPEQILGREITEKCDVFNLGLVVAYAATGRHAYGEGRPDAVMYRISNLDADLEGIDEPVVAAIRRCLERDPALRPSMSELLAFFASGGRESLPDLPPDSTIIVQPGQIDRVVKSARGQAGSSADPPNIPPGDPPAAPSPPPPGGPKRRWGSRILALAALIVIGGAIGFFVSQSSSSDETSSPATTSLALTESDSSVQAPGTTAAPSEALVATTAAPTTSTYSLVSTTTRASVATTTRASVTTTTRALVTTTTLAAVALADPVTTTTTTPKATIQTYSVGKSPHGVAFDGSHIWVTNHDDATVSRLRASDGRLIATYSVGAKPKPVVFDGSHIWVADSFHPIRRSSYEEKPYSSLYKFRASDGSLVDTYSVSDGCGTYQGSDGWVHSRSGCVRDILFDGTYLWVLLGNQTIWKLRPSDASTVAKYSFSSEILESFGEVMEWGGIAFDGAHIWSTARTLFEGRSAGVVVKMRASDGVVIGVYQVGREPYGVTFDGTFVWVVNHLDWTITKIEAATGQIRGTYPVEGNGERTGVVFDGTDIWVVNGDLYGGDSVTRLRTTDGSVIDTFKVGSAPTGAVYDGTSLWVANARSNSVSKVTPPRSTG